MFPPNAPPEGPAPQLPAPLPPPAPPTAASMLAPPLPLSKDDLTFWATEIERAKKLNVDTIAAWDVKGNLERYTPKNVAKASKDINVAKDFSDVERKKAALFYDTPQIALIPDQGTAGPPLMLFQELLNALLSPKRMKSKATAMAAIQDCLVAIQPCPTEIGYTAITEMVQPPAPPMPPPVPGMAAASDQPAGLPSSLAGEAPAPVPVTVYEHIFWDKLSPASILIPRLFQSTKYDDAPWLGYRWRRPASQVRREHSLGEEVPLSDNSGDDKPYFEPLGEGDPDNGEPMCSGVKLWYRACLRDPAVSHPLVIRELVLVDGVEQPVVHKPLACQTIGPDGRLTADSMVGYPLHPLALRDLTDCAYVAADVTLTAPLTRELNKFRTQVIQRRDGSRLHTLIDVSRINDEVRQKIGQGDEPTMIPVEAGALDAGADKIMAQVPALTLGRESYEGQHMIERDRAQVLGIDANQVGTAGASGSKTATEVQNVQRNADARFEQERLRALEWWLCGVQKVAALVLRYGDRIAVDVLGPQRGQQWIQSKGQLGAFSYDTVIDSGNYIDLEARKRQTLQLYNMTAQDPATHHEEILQQMAYEFGIDPAKWIVTEKPEKHPDPPALSINVKPEDLDPALPSYVGTHAILTAGGIKGLPPPLTMAQAPALPGAGGAALQLPPGAPPPGGAPLSPPLQEHGGMTERAPLLNQHQQDETGQRSGPPVL